MKNPDLALGNPIKFYNNEITLRFSERDHIYYLVDGDDLAPLDGVTQTCGILDKSMYLLPWGCKMMAEKLLRTMPKNVDELGEYTQSLSLADFETLVTEAKKAHKERLVDAGDVGSAAHIWLEDSIRHAIDHNNGVVQELDYKIPNDERAVNCGNAAFDWMKKHNVRWLKTEHKIYSRKYKYAGTMDGLALVDACDNPICCGRFSLFLNQCSVIDWKSSNNLRTEYLYQTAAYQQAEIEEYGSAVKSRWILRLGKEDGKFEPWYETDFENDFKGFKLCLTLKRQHAMIEKRISDNKKLLTQMKKRLRQKDVE
jgi:hypothetical protein